MNPITADDGSANSYHQITVPKSDPRSESTVSLQGDANDFTWSIEQKASGAPSWQAIADSDGADEFTGCQPQAFKPCTDVAYRVRVTALGTATYVIVSTN